MEKIIRNPNLQVVFAITLMAVLGTSSIAPVLPKIAGHFGIAASRASLVIVLFTLPGVLLMPFLGFLADRFGRKRHLIISLILFAAAGTLCAGAADFRILLFLRFLQGLGAASLGMLNITLIGDLFKGPERIEAMGTNAVVLSVGTAVYPALGGFLAHYGWHYPFLLSLLALPVTFFTALRLHEPDRPQPERLRRYLGKTFSLLARRTTMSLFAGIVTAFIIIYGISLTLFPFFMKDVFGSSPRSIGLFLCLMSVGTIFASWQLKHLARFFGEKRLVLLGFSLYILICSVFPFLRHQGAVALAAWVFGFAHGTTIPTLMGILTEHAPARYRAAVMAFNGIFLRLGQTIGPFLLAWIYSRAGLGFSFWTGCLLSLAAVGILLPVSFGQKARKTPFLTE